MDVKLDYVSSFPEASDRNSFGKASQGEYRGQRYWILWTDELGAWIDSDGRQVIITVKESSRSAEIAGSLTLGFTSVITGACLSLQNQVAIHANTVSIDSQAIAFIQCKFDEKYSGQT